MKKLISKNPVEQFKTGIRFAKGGTSFNMSGLRRHGSLANATYTDWNGKVVFKNGQLTADAKNYLLNKYGKDYTLRTEANMRKGNIWDRSLKTSKSPYGKWRIDNGRADSKWNNEIAQKALKNRTDVKKDINGNLYLKVKNFDGTYSQMYLNDDSVYSKQSPETSIVNFEDLSPKEKEELLSRYTLKFQVNPLVGLVGLGGIFSKYLSRAFAPKALPSTLKMLGSQKLLGAPTINGVQVYPSPLPSPNYEWVKYIPVNKKGGKLKVKMADGSGTITIDTPDKDQLAGRKPVGKTKDGENLYLNGDGKVVKHNPKEGPEQTNWMEKGGITKHQRGAKFMGTGVQRGWTSSYGNNLWNGITADLKLALIGTGKFTEDSFKDARSLQTALNKYFEGNAATMNNRDFTASRIAVDNKWGDLSLKASRIAVDNKWGDLSLKALMHALSMANYDEARPLNVSNVNPVNAPLNGMSTIPTKIEARPEHMYNRAEVRQLLRNQGINPYSLSGALRQAIRFALNGGHEYNKALLQGIDLKRLTQPVTIGNKETSTFNTLPTIQIKDPGHIPTVPVSKLGGRLISKDPVKQFKLGGSIAKYGLGDRMASYVKEKKSELNRAKAAANSWSGYELTYPVFTQNGIATKGVVSGRNYVPEITVTANKEGARKSRLNEVSQRNASLAKMQDTLFRIGAYDRNKTLYRQAVDGMMGGLTRNAIKRAREMGYEVNEKTGEIKKLNRKGLVQKATDLVHNINEKMKPIKGPVENPRILFMTSMGNTVPSQVLALATLDNESKQTGFIKGVRNLLKNVSPQYRVMDYFLDFNPVTLYVKDLAHHNITPEGSSDIKLTNKDFSDSYNRDLSRLALIAYRQYVRKNGKPKPGEKFSLSIEPSVYKEINSDNKYANFSLQNIIKAALGGDGSNLVEFTDGGMSGTAVINPETKKLDITFTDRTAWDNAPKGDGIGSKMRQFMERHGSSGLDNKGDYIQELLYSIPSDTLAGNFRGRLGAIKSYY